MSSIVDQQIQLTRVGNVCIVTFTGKIHKANVFTIPILQRVDALLDEIEENHLPCAVVFVGTGKFFSAGFDLQALTGTSRNQKNNGNGESKNSNSSSSKSPQGQALVNYSWKILARLLIFPAPTFSLFNGHAFGLGLFWGLACDHRIMVEGTKGFLCLPEITIGLPLGSGFAALANCKMNSNTLRTSALTGKKWNYKEALEAGIIDAVLPISASTTTDEKGLIPKQALKMAELLVSTSEKGNLSAIKMELYHETYMALVHPKSNL
jgi:enoyl-CoA hydratase/carnithine racemase